MRTISDSHRQSNGAYFGDYPDWLVAYAVHRDSDLIERSNWEAMQARLANVSGWHVETSSHWAVGYIEHLIVRPRYTAYRLTKRMVAQIKDYPLLDEERYSEMEYDEMARIWAQMSMRERIRILAEHNDSIFAARCADIGELSDRTHMTHEYIRTLAYE